MDLCHTVPELLLDTSDSQALGLESESDKREGERGVKLSILQITIDDCLNCDILLHETRNDFYFKNDTLEINNRVHLPVKKKKASKELLIKSLSSTRPPREVRFFAWCSACLN